jgi:hypothetical protein
MNEVKTVSISYDEFNQIYHNGKFRANYYNKVNDILQEKLKMQFYCSKTYNKNNTMSIYVCCRKCHVPSSLTTKKSFVEENKDVKFSIKVKCDHGEL